MTKQEIKKFFQAIRDRDFEKVKELVEKDEAYLSVTNFSPPKKDDGQSGLQVAFKTGNFEIAEFLIGKGANVNFQESSDINAWTAPVLHDCIRATIFTAKSKDNTESDFEQAFNVLQLMLKRNADPKSADSYGNNSLHRAYLDTRQVIDNPYYEQETALKQIRKVFSTLIKAGADINLSSEGGENLAEMIKEDDMGKYNLV
jgi:ankyrin repeat protein